MRACFKIFILLFMLSFTFLRSQTYINYVTGKYVGIVYRNACPNQFMGPGALYIEPSTNYSFTVYENDSSSLGSWAEPWEIIVNSDSTLRRYVGGQDSVVYGQLFPNDSIYLYVTVFGAPFCHRIFYGFKLYSTISIDDLNKTENELLISPQPANDVTYIQSTQLVFRQEDIPVIYDISGKQYTIPIQYINKNTYKLDVSNLSGGIYVVAIKTENVIVRKKMIVQ
jgi:hypothetical protein